MCLWTDTGVWTLAVMIIKVIWHLNQPHFGDKASPVCTAHSRTKCPKGKQTSSLYLHSYTTPSPPPKLLLSTPWHFAKKKEKKFFFSAAATLLPPSLPSLPPSLLHRSVRERQRNFIEKMEGTGKTRVPGGVLQGFRLHQRLPFSAGRWTHNGKMSVAAVTRTSHWLGFRERGEGWVEGHGWGSQLRHFNNKLNRWRAHKPAPLPASPNLKKNQGVRNLTLRVRRVPVHLRRRCCRT